ncbi:MAG TPA: TonB-dependent receptor [Edaphobacter sp.]|nr:TonB-dependent receptor [Edaphobacter sp.]
MLDSSGSIVPGAIVSATDQATGVVTVRKSTSAGLYTISPIAQGTYTVTVSAPGFSQFVQKNLTINALKLTGLNVTLQVGSTSQEVTVTDAPPALETTNASLGGVIENETYTNLPIQMGGQQRDATAFATLLPGSQGGARAPIIGGTSNYTAELYLDGMPLTIATQQGDNRVIFNSVPIEAVNQFQVLTSSIPAEYQGAGMLNFTVKSGQQQYHGSTSMYFRNTIFDTWGYTAKAATAKDANGNTIPARKPYENQNELAATIGGPIPFTAHKGFFSFTYDRYHGRQGVNPGLLTVPTTQMRNGDFSQLLKKNGGPGYILYDPLSQAACTANNGTPCRYAYGQDYTGAPVLPTSNGGHPEALLGANANIIPANEISPISQYMQKYLPDPTNSNLANNYLGGLPSGYDNWSYVWRVDYDLTSKQRLSLVNTKGNRLNVPYTFAVSPTLPVPYARATKARVVINVATIEHDWTLRPNIQNQFKFNFLQFGGPPITNATEGITQYEATTAGVTGLPAGQASTEFPSITFSNSGTTQWANGAAGATQTSVSNGYTFVDNLLIVKGQHSITAGFQLQFLQANAAAANGYSTPFTQSYNNNPTAGIATSSTVLTGTGYDYATYLLGGVTGGGTTIQSFGETAGRYRPFAPYVEDDWKVTPKLTLNLGLRWDYLPPYQEAHDRWSFLNPNLTNPLTGNLGVLQFAGNHGEGISCNCRTPVHTYWKNWGPRLGMAYSIDDKTVVRAGFGISYSHAGGVGGRTGSFNGTGATGYSASAAPTAINGNSINPNYWLNNSTTFTGAGLGNTQFGGPGYVLPTPPGPSIAGTELNTGNYVSGSTRIAPNGVSYADPYISGRAPTFTFFNGGMERAITRDITISANYAGSVSHFISPSGANARGYWVNQLNPSYLPALGNIYVASGSKQVPLLQAQATAANIAVAQAALPGIKVPFSQFVAAGAISTGVTIQQMLVAFPQYGTITDTWGQNVGNATYNSFQLSLQQRPFKGVTYQVNYTYSKNLGDDGTFRSGFDIPGGAIDGGQSFKQDSVEHSYTATNLPENLSIFGTAESPFGRNKIGADNLLVRSFAGGWRLSGIFTYRSGTPLAITSASCQTIAGQCMPDLNPNFSGYLSKKARIGGSWNVGATGANPGGQQKIDPNAFMTASTYGTAAQCSTSGCIGAIGNSPRTSPYMLVAPSSYNLDLGLKRDFPITKERVKFQFEADCLNVTHKHTFGGIGTSLSAPSSAVGNTSYASSNSATTSAFGRASSVSGNRDWQLAGHLIF